MEAKEVIYTENIKAIGAALRHIRKEKKITLEDIAHRFDPAYMSRIERGQKNVSVKAISEILYLYNESIKRLFELV